MMCPFCGSVDLRRKGWRKLKGGRLKRIYKCRSCGKRFVEKPEKRGRIYDEETVRLTLTLIKNGFNVRRTMRVLEEVFGDRPSYATIMSWKKKYLDAGSPNLQAAR